MRDEVVGKPIKFKCPDCGKTHCNIVICKIKTKSKLCDDCKRKHTTQKYIYSQMRRKDA